MATKPKMIEICLTEREVRHLLLMAESYIPSTHTGRITKADQKIESQIEAKLIEAMAS